MTELNILFEFKFGAWCDRVFLVATRKNGAGHVYVFVVVVAVVVVVVAVFVFNLLCISKFKCYLWA